MMRLKIAILLLFSCVAGMNAQEFTYIDWQILRADTLPVWYEEVIPLEEDYRNISYEVRLEYPEYSLLSAEEAKRVAVWATSLPEHPEVHSDVAVTRKQGVLDISFIPFVCRDGKYYKLLSFKMVIERTPFASVRAVPHKRELSAERYADNSVLSQGRWVKIGITEDGIYRLTYADLQRMGFSDASRVKLYGYGGHLQTELIDADADFDDLEEVPLYRDGKGVLFWGNGLVSWSATNTRGTASHQINHYARQACYFLTEGDEPMAISVVSLDDGTQNDLHYTPANVLYKKEEFAWYQSGRMLYEGTDYAYSNSHTYHLPTIDPVVSNGGSLTVSYTAASSNASVVQPVVDGVSYNEIKISALSSDGYTVAMAGTSTYSLSSLQDGSAGTEVKLTATPGVTGHLSYMELCYQRQLKMTTPYLYIRHNVKSASRFVIDTDGRSNVKLWRIGSRGVPMTEIAGTREGNTYTVPVDNPTAEYVAVDVDADYPSPVYVGETENQNLHAIRDIDMVIIVPTSGKLWTQAERLAEAHRRIDGLRVQVVSAMQLYNEFSSGTPDATAYRRFMKMLYDRAETEEDMPRYLLLFGDGVWDNRMLSAGTQDLNPDDYLLCYESPNSLSHTLSYVLEDYFGLLDDGEGGNLTSNKVDIGIGRFPVTTEAEAKVMVDKTIDYMEKKNAGSWRNIICVLGDDGDSNLHLSMAEQLSAEIETNYPEMQVNRIYWDAYKRVSSTTSNSYPGVVADIKTQMEEGCLMMNYTGHGNERSMSHELVLKIDDFSSFNSNKAPLWVTAACDIAPFDKLVENIGERAVLHEGGSAVAFYGTTRTVYPYPNSYMNRYFTRFVLGKDENGRRYRLGDAVRLAKTNLVTGTMTDNTPNKFHYVLLGDPALKLGKPEYSLVVDSINGCLMEDENVYATFKAGSMARLSGHVEDDEGNLCPDFQGTVSVTVYDSESLITCLNNEQGNHDPFTFYTRDKRLYMGSDYVRDGSFDMEFPIPLDIKYSGEAGRIILYAINEESVLDANGYSENVWVGGSSDELAGDNEGPKITAYLNWEDFVSGGTVNSTPYFVAILEDESGINTTNTAVGHDLELIVDGDPSTSYILNNEYEHVLGDYTKGRVAYSIPSLPEGQHTLLFRAWDVLNNSSTLTLDFKVDGGLVPDLIDLSCTENPAREQTTFIVRYDRPGTECNFTLEVFDFAGRTLWRHTEQGTNGDGVYPVSWNLTTSAGMPLSTGVYLYRVSVSSDESKAASRTNKLVILRNK